MLGGCLPHTDLDDWVWEWRPNTVESSAKTETWWTGPVVVEKRTGEASYLVELNPGELHMVHADRIKPCVHGEPVNFYHFRQDTPKRESPHANGRWKNSGSSLGGRQAPVFDSIGGSGSGGETWELVGNFVHRYSYKLLEYCRRRGIRLDLAEKGTDIWGFLFSFFSLVQGSLIHWRVIFKCTASSLPCLAYLRRLDCSLRIF